MQDRHRSRNIDRYYKLRARYCYYIVRQIFANHSPVDQRVEIILKNQKSTIFIILRSVLTSIACNSFYVMSYTVLKKRRN